MEQCLVRPNHEVVAQILLAGEISAKLGGAVLPEAAF